MNDPTSPSPPPNNARGYETQRVRAWPIAVIGISLLTLTAILGIAVKRFDQWITTAEHKQALPEPRYQPANKVSGYEHWGNPSAELAAARQRDARRLDEYAWVDRDKGSVRIPIERAMELQAADAKKATAKKNSNADAEGSEHDEKQPPE
jgi:hypothetical protein